MSLLKLKFSLVNVLANMKECNFPLSCEFLSDYFAYTGKLLTLCVHFVATGLNSCAACVGSNSCSFWALTGL